MNKQNNNHKTKTAEALTISRSSPAPSNIWEQMIRFSGPSASEKSAMQKTVDVLFRRGYEMVIATYNYLQETPETAEILGWEQGFDEEHLSERRRFFTIWLARTLSIDMGTDFARYLFHAGRIHAGHGPRHIHTPPRWITGSIGLVLGAFSDFIRGEHDDPDLIAQSLAGWGKYLTIQLNQMNTGYAIAQNLEQGYHTLSVKVYGTARQRWGRDSISIGFHEHDTVEDALRKLTDYAPVLRDMMFERAWDAAEDEKDDWMRVTAILKLRDNWRILLNGQDLWYYGGFKRHIKSGDELSLFPPGR